eukprot:2118542-Rhodomonas_salina.5
MFTVGGVGGTSPAPLAQRSGGGGAAMPSTGGGRARSSLFTSRSPLSVLTFTMDPHLPCTRPASG